MIIELKVWPQFFDPLLEGTKTFEIRETRDRKFSVGDKLYLYEWDPIKEARTGQSMIREVTYITDFAQRPGYVVMGLK